MKETDLQLLDRIKALPLSQTAAAKLFEWAEALELPGRTYMTRTELIEALRAA